MLAVDGDFLTIADVAERLKLNPQTVRNWVDAGRLSVHRVGRRVRIGRADFDAFIDAGYQRRKTVEPISQAEAFRSGSLLTEAVLPQTRAMIGNDAKNGM